MFEFEASRRSRPFEKSVGVRVSLADFFVRWIVVRGRINSGKMSEEGDKWFVIHCVEDDSLVLLEREAVIYDESVKTGDKVKFTYPGVKKFLDGTVKGMSGEFGFIYVVTILVIKYSNLNPYLTLSCLPTGRRDNLTLVLFGDSHTMLETLFRLCSSETL